MPYRAPDGGWGWCVLCMAVLNNFITGGIQKSSSIVVLEIRNELKVSEYQAFCIPAILTFFFLASAPITTVLCQKFTCQKMVFFGSILTVIGMISSSFIKNIYVLYVTYGFCIGVGFNISFFASFLSIGAYFDRHRGFCNAIFLAGNCLGGMILPIFLTHWFDIYGFQGAFLLVGGLELNKLASVLVFQPVDKHLIPVSADELQDNQQLHQDFPQPVKAMVVTNELESDFSASINGSSNSSSYADMIANYFADSTYNTVTENQNSGINNQVLPFKRGFSQSKITRESSFASIQKEGNEKRSQEVLRRTSISSSISRAVKKIDENFAAVPETEEVSNLLPAERTRFRLISVTSVDSEADPAEAKPSVKRTLSARRRTRYASFSSVSESLASCQVSNAFLGSSVNVIEELARSEANKAKERKRIGSISEMSDGTNENQTKVAEQETATSKLSEIDFTILLNPIFCLTLLTSISQTIGYNNSHNFMATYALIEKKFTKPQVSCLFFLLNGFDFCGRITTALTQRYLKVPAVISYSLSMFTCGCIASMLIFNPTYYVVATVICGIGFFSGIHIASNPTMQGEELGQEKVKLTFPFSLMLQGIISLGGPVLSSYIADAAGNYRSMYLFLGCTQMAGGLVWLTYPLAKRVANIKK